MMEAHLDIAEETAEEVSSSKTAYFVVKRLIDIVLSLIGFVCLSPLLLITVIAIRLEDGGPAIYKQKRIGKDYKVFDVYKFRSMCKDAEQMHEQMREDCGETEVSFKLKDDPRVTNVGRIIRKFNIDELPQLINILKGDMTLVGPRPLPDYESEEMEKRYGKKYAKRYTVPQGLTCYWQIADRASVSFEERMEMDCRYAETCCLKTDIILIIKTFVSTVTGKAEY